MFQKLANTVEMSFDVPDSEKEVGVVASDLFEAVVSVLDLAKDHLNVMYVPFKKYEKISTEKLIERRGLLNRYKQQVIKNYNKVKAYALKAIQKLNYFATDTHTLELINSFKDSIEDLEKQVSIFLDILDNYKSSDFKDHIISAIEGIKKQSAQVEKLIKDRIIDHIDANILAKDWVTNTGNELHLKIQDRVPLVVELFNERQKALEFSPTNIPDLQKRPQILNPGNAQRVYYPTDVRSSDYTGEY